MIPLCLLTPDNQNRRIIDRYLRQAGCEPMPTLESNSMIVLLTHVQTGAWATVVPSVLAKTFAAGDDVSVIPIASADVPSVGLVYPKRDPLPPQTTALIEQARKLAAEFAQSDQPMGALDYVTQ
jgi:DNA-binding transcriptional LysR family regulator